MSIPYHAAYGEAGTAVSSTTTYISDSTDIKHESDVSYVVKFTGTPVGTLTVEVSNSSDNKVRLVTDVWTTYTGVTIPAITTAVTLGIELKRLAYRRVRLKYVNASSTGTVFAELTTKGPA